MKAGASLIAKKEPILFTLLKCQKCATGSSWFCDPSSRRQHHRQQQASEFVWNVSLMNAVLVCGGSVAWFSAHCPACLTCLRTSVMMRLLLSQISMLRAHLSQTNKLTGISSTVPQKLFPSGEQLQTSPQSYQGVFKDLPQVIVKMPSLVVFCRQDVAKSVQVGYIHENSLEDRFTSFMFDLLFLRQTH